MYTRHRMSLPVEIGTKMTLDATGLDHRFTTKLVGCIPGVCLMVTIPIEPQADKDFVLHHLYAGREVTVRYLHGGSVVGFKTFIKNYVFSPYPILFLVYPGTTESYNLRKQPRISCILPAMTSLRSDTYDSVMMNISVDGCGVLLAEKETGRLGAKLHDPISLRCEYFPDCPGVTIPAKIMRIDSVDGKVELGLRFDNVDEKVEEAISRFIAQVSSIIA